MNLAPRAFSYLTYVICNGSCLSGIFLNICSQQRREEIATNILCALLAIVIIIYVFILDESLINHGEFSFLFS